ncbi:tetratricopeptide repeat protein [Elusimicrobiota bacterium]
MVLLRIAITAVLFLVFQIAFSGQSLKVYQRIPPFIELTGESIKITHTIDIALVSSGLRLLMADIGMIRMLIYYGTHLRHQHSDHNRNGHQDEEHEDWHKISGLKPTGMYTDLLSLTKHTLSLDPFFRHAILYGTGSLAFNEKREYEATAIIKEAMEIDKTCWSYPMMLSAITYKQMGDHLHLLESLEKVRKRPECPSMLKNILANIYLKLHKYNEAIGIYEELLSTAEEQEYRDLAERKLAELKMGRR